MPGARRVLSRSPAASVPRRVAQSEGHVQSHAPAPGVHPERPQDLDGSLPRPGPRAGIHSAWGCLHRGRGANRPRRPRLRRSAPGSRSSARGLHARKPRGRSARCPPGGRTRPGRARAVAEQGDPATHVGGVGGHGYTMPAPSAWHAAGRSCCTATSPTSPRAPAARRRRPTGGSPPRTRTRRGAPRTAAPSPESEAGS
jgi:hypothetical protein